jgi:hypothetical protein
MRKTETNGSSGQFIPISAMVMFTMMIFMIAVVNVYRVSRAKLKIQNLADAAALNLASQQAQAYNLIADKNEWLNHMVAGVPSPSDPNAPAGIRDCSLFNDANKTLIPGVSCAENNGGKNKKTADLWAARDPVFQRHIFYSVNGARNYAMVVHTVNEAQRLFPRLAYWQCDYPGPYDRTAKFPRIIKTRYSGTRGPDDPYGGMEFEWAV